jgi:hypothetical protein
MNVHIDVVVVYVNVPKGTEGSYLSNSHFSA